MKHIGIAAAITLFASSGTIAADLQIFSVFDGPLSGGVPKGISVLALSNITDLSQYGVGSANNGGGSDGVEFRFPTIAISEGDTLFIASESTGFQQFFGFAPDFVTNAVNINGDDAIELFYENQIIDRFGNSHQDGSGTPWEYQDGWALQKSGRSASPEFDGSQWSYSGANAWDNETSNSTALYPLVLNSDSDSSNETPQDETLSPTLISTIQGTPDTQTTNIYGESDVSPLIGKQVAIEGIVVGDFQSGDDDNTRNLDGFFVQEESFDEDSTPRSSEGIFVYDPETHVDVKLGDKVYVVGEVDQYYSETQLSNVKTIEIRDTNLLGSVQPATISLQNFTAISESQNGGYQPDLEAFEGMLIKVTDTLTITEQYQLDRFNEIRLSAGERPQQFTQRYAPNRDLFLQWQKQLAAQTLIYDDGLNEQNQTINLLEGFGPYTELSAPRMGDYVTNLIGILDYKWAGNNASGASWRVRAVKDGDNSFTSTLLGNSPNPRPNTVPNTRGNVKIASFNVLNLFTTIDKKDVVTAAGHEPRGADNQNELDRQLAKIVNAITELNPDIVGLIELENEFDSVNDGSTAIELLVNALNQRIGFDTYTYVYPGTRFVGSDAIATGLIYKPAVVEIAPGSTPAILDDSIAAKLSAFSDTDLTQNPVFNGEATNRVPVAASFIHHNSGEIFTVAVNHFKSKGASGLEESASPNFDQLDGAGYWNQRRLNAARALIGWLKTSPTGINDQDVLIVGDLNAYAKEAPVQYLLNNGFNDALDTEDYSYVFDGQTGTLDYMLLSDSLRHKLETADVWHINADEADALDYNLDYGRSDSYFDATTAFRSSDHDPIIGGFLFEATKEARPNLVTVFREATTENQITGTSRGRLLSLLKLMTFESILYQAENRIEQGQRQKACLLFKAALYLSDGKPRPKDLIKGDGLKSISAALEQAISEACSD